MPSEMHYTARYSWGQITHYICKNCTTCEHTLVCPFGIKVTLFSLKFHQKKHVWFKMTQVIIVTQCKKAEQERLGTEMPGVALDIHKNAQGNFCKNCATMLRPLQLNVCSCDYLLSSHSALCECFHKFVHEVAENLPVPWQEHQQALKS